MFNRRVDEGFTNPCFTRHELQNLSYPLRCLWSCWGDCRGFALGAISVKHMYWTWIFAKEPFHAHNSLGPRTTIEDTIMKKLKSCKETALYYSNSFPRSTERKTVTVTELFVVSKEEQHQSLHYINLFSQEYYAVKFPAPPPPKKKKYVIILSQMVCYGFCSAHTHIWIVYTYMHACIHTYIHTLHTYIL